MLISQPQILIRRIPWMSLAASMCGRIGSLFPKVLCSSLLTWSIYAFILSACYETLISSNTSTLAGFSLGAVGILLYVLSVYTYFKVVNAGSGSPLDFEELKIRVQDSSQQPTYNSANPYDTEQPSVSHGLLQNAEDIEEDRSIPTEEPPRDIMTQHTFKSGKKNFRYCNKCRVWKPDRCHHCSSCKRCVLKMDHHCPWFATCVGFYNHKFFVQFLLYTTVYAGFVFFVTLYLLWGFFTDERYLDQYLSLQLVFLFVLSLVFFISLLVFSIFLIYLLLKNLTTIEFQEQRWNTSNTGKNFSYEFDSTGKKKDLGNIFDLGSKENWCNVMGDSWIYWLLPITITSRSVHSTMKNGINYRINQNTYEKWCRNAELQNQLNKQLEAYRKRVRMDREAAQEMV